MRRHDLPQKYDQDRIRGQAAPNILRRPFKAHKVLCRTRSASLALARFLTRCDALEIPKATVACQREDGALWVRALGDPAATRHFSRAPEDLTAPGLHPPQGRVNVADTEVVKPAGSGHCRRLGHHAADRLPAGGELLIRAHGVDVGFRFLPSKELAIKSPRFLPVGGEQLVPANAALCERISGLLLTRAVPLEQRKRCHLRVRDD